jgi:molecular chaperone GrpE (heat shock protein)
LRHSRSAKAEAERANAAFAEEQRQMQADQAAIEKARAANTIDAFTDYLKSFQRYASEATGRIKALLQGVTRQ